MKLGQLPADTVARRLSGDGLALRTGPFNVRIRSRSRLLRDAVRLLYAGHLVIDGDAFCDVTLEIAPPRRLLRRWFRPQVRAYFDGHPLFEPLPAAQAYPLLEWTMNWWISSHAHQYLLLHAAVVERGGCAAILPAPPGSGKSTLCAALVQRGWRLLSDELAMIALASGQLEALVRPVSLKNASLDVIRQFAPKVVLSHPARDTAKGTVAHMLPKEDDVARSDEPARARWVIFPSYTPAAPAVLTARPKADALMELGRNAFNYTLLGRAGFDVLADVVTTSDCFDFNYSALDDAICVFERLFSQHRDDA